MSISKYVHGEIKKVVNGNVYEVMYVTLKHCNEFDGKADERTINNNNFITSYILYKNNKFIGTFGRNYTKEELLKELDRLIQIY